MILGLWLPRLNHLRSLGPIADAARRRGWKVVALCPTGGPKYDAHRQRPVIEALGIPAATVRGAGEALEALEHVDAVVAVGLVQPEWVRQHVMPRSRQRGTLWASVGYLQEELLQILEVGPAVLYDWDLSTTSTPAGVDWLAEQLARRSAAQAGFVRRRLVPVGAPAFDPLLTLDREACRAKYGLPREGRILLFVPAAFPHLMARWRRWVFDGPLSWAAWAMVLPTYRRVGEAVRAYAERHGAWVVVKTREKNPDPPWLARLGGWRFGDVSWHPHTALELCVAADAYAGFASGMALEATAAGLRQTHFFAWPPEAAEHPLFLPFRRRYWLQRGPWNFPGVADALDLHRGPWLAEAWVGNSRWPARVAADDAQAALRAITGPLDGEASHRLMDAIKVAR